MVLLVFNCIFIPCIFRIWNPFSSLVPSFWIRGKVSICYVTLGCSMNIFNNYFHINQFSQFYTKHIVLFLSKWNTGSTFRRLFEILCIPTHVMTHKLSNFIKWETIDMWISRTCYKCIILRIQYITHTIYYAYNMQQNMS